MTVSSNGGWIIKYHRCPEPFFWQRYSLSPYHIVVEASGKHRLFPHPELPVVLDVKLSGNTFPDLVLVGRGIDPYVPLERRWRITRRILEVLAKHRFPLLIITRYDLILRDIDLLRELHEEAHVVIGVPMFSLSLKISRVFKSAYPKPRSRVILLDRVSRSGVPTGILLDPLIKGLNDNESQLRPLFQLGKDLRLDFISLGRYPSHLSSQSRLLLKQLSEEYNISLTIPRYRPSDFRRENYWVAGQLAERAIISCLEKKFFRSLHRAACRFNLLPKDVRSLWQGRDEQTLRELGGDAWPMVEELLDGRWAQDYPYPFSSRTSS